MHRRDRGRVRRESSCCPTNELEIFFFILRSGRERHDTQRAVRRHPRVRRQPGPGRPIPAEIPTPSRARSRKYCGGRRRSSSGCEAQRRDVVLADTPIKKGSRVVTMLRSANRDEDVFDQCPSTSTCAPDPNPHVAFGGGGAHHCLGAMLARAEIRAALDEMLFTTDDIGLGRAEDSAPEHVIEHDCLRITSNRSQPHQ